MLSYDASITTSVDILRPLFTRSQDAKDSGCIEPSSADYLLLSTPKPI